MNIGKFNLAAIVLVASVVSGCASYRTSSNIESEAKPTAGTNGKVVISESALPNQKYTALGPVEVSVKKLTIFHKDPTKEQANEALTEKARAIGADAVVNVTYQSGIGFTSWGYIDAKGTAVKFVK